MKQIDLHVHSLASDGTMTPTEIVEYALEKGLSAFALTDHDTVAGIEEAMKAAKGKNIRVIPGVEISCEHNSQDIHVLGLNVDYKNKPFIEKLESAHTSRYFRNEKIVEKLSKDGFDISMEQIYKEFPNAIITRSHISKHLMRKGYVSSIAEGFQAYLNPGAPYYIPRQRISPKEAIHWIHQAGGKAVLAHPLLYPLTQKELWKLVYKLEACGLDGLEALYSCNVNKDQANMIKLAEELDLCISGGSDFHGINKPTIDLMTGKGDLYIPEMLLKDLGL